MRPSGDCPDENVLNAWAGGHTSPEDLPSMTAHLESCSSCREAFAAVATDPLHSDSTLVTPAQRAGRSSSEVAVGEVLAGKYEVIGLVGMGGMGVVLKAKHLQLNTSVALKLIRSEMLGDADAASRFAREARAASRLKSPHANRVLDFEHLPNGTPYMVMEYLEGETLEERRHRTPAISERELTRLMRQGVSALREAHQLGIVHRDLKPSNLFLRRDAAGLESLVVLDFGIAKSANPDIELGLAQTSVGGVVGSPAFMAPEQLTTGGVVDARTDVWALGCTMHTVLAGAPPFRGSDFIDLAWKIRNNGPAELPAWVSSPMRACIKRCLSRDPQGRYQNIAELDVALGELEAMAPEARPSRSVLMAAAAGLVLMAVFIGGWAVLQPAAEQAQLVEPVAAPPPLAPAVEVTSPPPIEKAPQVAGARKAAPKVKPAHDAGNDDVFRTRF